MHDFVLAVQCISEHNVLISGDGGIDSGGVSGQHIRGGEVEERQRDAMVGEVQNVPRRQQKRRVLYIAIQSQQVLSTNIRGRSGAIFSNQSFS